MNIIINITYNSPDINSKSMRSGLFPLKGKSSEHVAYEFWKWIKSEEPLDLELVNVTVDGEQDITEKVKKLEKAPLD